MAEREIGRVVKSNSHVDYVVQVFGVGEVPDPPAPEEYGFGRFVRIPVNDAIDLIGVVYDTQLMNPEYGTLGPRLSPETELRVFSPDYLTEKATLLGVVALGTRIWQPEVSRAATYSHNTPPVAATVDAPVDLLADEDVLAFHRPSGLLRVGYFPRLLTTPAPVLPDLLCSIVDMLARAFPREAGALDVIRKNLRWRSAIGQAQ